MAKEKKIRIFHTLARSGATLVCKCIGCMSNIVLLSEVNPVSSEIAHKEGVQGFNPLLQAITWFNIIRPEDIIGKRYNWIEIMQLIVSRCEDNFKQLVIRDMTSIDFTGIPSLIKPSYRLQHAELLSNFFEVIPFALVRHPIDLWLSQRLLPYLKSMSIDYFLDSYYEYAKQIQIFGFIQYEDFAENPERQMQIICDKLQLQFDKNFLYIGQATTK